REGPRGSTAAADVPDVVEQQDIQREQIEIRRAVGLQQPQDAPLPVGEFRVLRPRQDHQAQHPASHPRLQRSGGKPRVADAQALEFP
ncbi:hypothetical protein RZS08_22345, partial [Arthrospira platensis SPKY1]|nr:hypothetical protein [Arthrospira platensis SPKY1]